MFCPQCKAEYRVGFTKCSDCDAELVDHLPTDAPATEVGGFEVDHFEADHPELVVVRTYKSVLDADLAKTALEAAGIDSMVRGDEISRRYLAVPLSIELLVRSEDVENAVEILSIDDEDGEPI